jgi:phage baseplate assembly protein W
MKSSLRASLVLDGLPGRDLSPSDLLSQQLQIVLNTRPGTMPWRPEFGCDLTSLVGQPATADNLMTAQQRVEAALSGALPGVVVEKVDVRLAAFSGSGEELTHPSIPLAEAALLRLGVQARLEVTLEVRVPSGPVTASATVDL